MIALRERVARPGEGWVTVGLLDGRSQLGHVARFSPYHPDLDLTVGPSSRGVPRRAARVLLPAERVAFVAFHRHPNERPRLAQSSDRRTVEVRVAGGARFLVEPWRTSDRDAVGFYATAVDSDETYREFFFYAHGMRAVADLEGPSSSEPLDAFQEVTGVFERPSLLDASHGSAAEKAKGPRLGEILVEAGLVGPDDIEIALARQRSGDTGPATGDGTVVKLVNQVILEAVRRGASDIHIEPNGADAGVTVRFRVDGDCIKYKDLSPQYRDAIVARIKVLSGLDIAEHRRPQDGKISLHLGEQRLELRVATLPTVDGNEDVTLRILTGAQPLALEAMRLSAFNLESLRQLVQRPHGMLLCVGPTGSGKTTTLHAALASINTEDRKILTAEDPVEITQPGLRQVQVNVRAGFTFAHAMRAFLRADPDVIMVGEMRDAETAGMAVEAALTGHLVLSTLHTNNAPETIVRLVDMGLDPFSFSDALLGVLAQRLARALCSSCREAYPASAAEIAELGTAYGEEAFSQRLESLGSSGFRLWRARGCAACGGTGYRGRIALHELLVASEPIKRAIQTRREPEHLRRMGTEAGMTTLLQDGIEKTLAGLTDLRQVLAVCRR
jgi:type II secretory ATPase GspE/PulE/Tfp pilus assembly ATPase PilB-like protein